MMIKHRAAILLFLVLFQLISSPDVRAQMMGGVSTPIQGGTAGTPASGANTVNVQGVNGMVPIQATSLASGAITNPTSTLTLPTRTPASSANAVTAASPCVFTWTATPAVNGETVVLSGTTAPGNGGQFTFGTPYYVVAKATNSIELAATLGGAALNCPTTAGVAVVSTLTYVPGDVIASNVAAGSIVVPSFAIATTAGGAVIPYLNIQTSATTGWNGVQVSVNLWRAAPTYTNGDMSTWAPATGSASYLGTYTGTLIQMGDGATGNLFPTSQVPILPKLASGTSVFWDIQMLGTAVPISAQVFTVTPGVMN